MLEWIGNLLVKTGIGALGDSFFKPYLAHLDNIDTVRAQLAAKEVEVQGLEIQAQSQLRIAEIGKWWEPDHLAQYIFVLYFGKVVVWDVMLGLGSTPALHGSVADWMGMIAIFLFGKRGVENVARILKR